MCFEDFARKVQVKFDENIIEIRLAHGTEFENSKFNKFYNKMGIIHNFLAPRTPQQNCFMERQNNSCGYWKDYADRFQTCLQLLGRIHEYFMLCDQ